MERMLVKIIQPAVNLMKHKDIISMLKYLRKKKKNPPLSFSQNKNVQMLRR